MFRVCLIDLSVTATSQQVHLLPTCNCSKFLNLLTQSLNPTTQKTAEKSVIIQILQVKVTNRVAFEHLQD
jgi:hypothetical protein